MTSLPSSKLEIDIESLYVHVITGQASRGGIIGHINNDISASLGLLGNLDASSGTGLSICLSLMEVFYV